MGGGAASRSGVLRTRAKVPSAIAAMTTSGSCSCNTCNKVLERLGAGVSMKVKAK